ncbi:MAG: nucleotidyltransferase family protein [Ruminococcaceae bacterium]|nr:nucleotidyltransferase family protein [Oscillospiraceae bacterium]
MKKNTAIICEYNPFHNGHLYQLQKVKEQSEIVICIMSGNTVQRGGFSCADKYERAKIAVNFGADLVVEHPFPYCMSSAADFASSGVFIANALKADTLAFGYEKKHNMLLKISDLLSEDGVFDSINNIYKKSDNKNLSYPKARVIYLSEIIGEENASLLKTPNNILSVEYLINLKKYNDMKPLFIKRNNEYISAGSIRDIIFDDSSDDKTKDISSFVPASPEKFFPFSDYNEAVLTYLNLCGQSSGIYDCDSSLYNRIIANAKKAKSVEHLVSLCTTSAYTSSKVRRAVFSIVFNTKTEDVKKMPSYTVLLGANEKGIKYISENKKRFEIPIFTRSTDEKKHSTDTSLLAKAEKIYSLLSKEEYTPYKKPYIKYRTRDE